jgi:hypothetical protein
MGIEIKIRQYRPARRPTSRIGRVSRVLAAAMPVMYLLPTVLGHFDTTRDLVPLSESVPLVGAAVSCYLAAGRGGAPVVAACLLLAT